ncbi:LOW QUALITY PROTEIN: neurofascin [Denticeps clupeoides]|uniref:LOW QUALITY PROTEIN: neurofascin n=1 Tax=Denticeps clupeoides TaxID=299321 RepID=UPI0010A34EEC|nr:LOW QUALITY PROTEIN: neurofascin-like [Denticeps clupeoides]
MVTLDKFALYALVWHLTWAMEIPPDVLQPPIIIKQSLKDHIVEPRDPIVVECEATGNPQPAFTWTRNGKYINVPRDPQVSMRRRSGTLEIFFWGRPDDYEGEYQCSATNEYGTALSNTINLRVSKSRSWPKEVLEPVTVFVGEPLILPCHPPVGPPKPDTFWMNSSMVPIRQSRRVSKAENGDLYFSYVLADDALTNYCCTARFPNANIIQRSSPVIIQVLTMRMVAEKAPSFMYPTGRSSSKIALLGEELVLECIAAGAPAPVIKWTKDWDQLSLEGKKLENFNKRIRIKAVTLGDSGEYVCTASNKMGYTEHAITVTVKAAPFWLEKPSNLIMSRETNGRMVCRSDGIPRPKVQWFINGEPFEDAARVIGRQVSGDTLIFNAVNVDSTAVYQCNASNQYGYLLANAFVSVMDMRARILGPQSQEFKVIEGTMTYLHCPYFGSPTPDLKWSKGAVGSLEGGRFKVFKNGTLEIRRTKLDDEGTYFCVVSNVLGREEKQIVLDVKEPAQIVRAPYNVAVLRGGEAKFDCQVTFDLTMSALTFWQKDNRTISTGRRILKDGESLTIINVNKKDEGYYSCTVRTELEEHTATARLRVMDHPEPPTELVLSEPSERSVRLTWRPGDSNHSPIKEYLIQVKEEWWFPSGWKNLTTYPGNLNSVVLQLSPYLSYQFRVIAVNALGQSPPSHSTEYFQTGGAVPDAIPKNIRGVGSGLWRNNLEITWEPLDERDWNGPKLRYVVWWRRRDSREEWKNITTMWWWHTIYDTDTFTAYEIKLQAMNAFGYGPESPVVIGYSGEDYPLEAPLNLGVSDIESTKLTVHWEPVSRNSIMGELKEYKVYYWRESSQLPWLSVSRRSKSKGFAATGPRLSGELTGLIPYSNYKMYIVVANNRYEGPTSSTIAFQTPEGVPSAPRSFKIQHRHLDSIYVEWERPAEPNGILTGYILRYQLLNATREERVREEQFPPNRTYFTVPRYDRYTRYKFSVAAMTQVGMGEMYTEESPHFTSDTYSTDQVDIVTQGWFIGLMCAIALLVLIMLVVFFIKRTRGGKYPVRDKKDFTMEPIDDKDQEGSFDYRSLKRISRVPTLPYTRREEDIRQLQRRRGSVEGIVRRMESDDSLVDYGEGGEGEFDEDGSFIGEYTGTSKRQGKAEQVYHDSSETTSPGNTIYTLA